MVKYNLTILLNIYNKLKILTINLKEVENIVKNLKL